MSESNVDSACIGIDNSLAIIMNNFHIRDMMLLEYRSVVLAFLLGNGYDPVTANLLANSDYVTKFYDSKELC